jgi:predicted Fe-Mo cluster-binding NifX family protein
MKIAFTSKGEAWDSAIDPRFGRADYILIYDTDQDSLQAIDNRTVQSVAHGAGPQTAKIIFDHAPSVLITGNGPGGNAAAILEKISLTIFVGAGGMTIREAYEAYKDNKLQKGDSHA